MNNILKETIRKLQNIHDHGFAGGSRAGDTGVGFALEALLGIEENNSSGADIDGQIEIKAKRKSSHSRSGSLTTLFTKAPNWLHKTRDIVKEYGLQDKERPERTNFYNSLKYGAVNPQGLSIDIDGDNLFFTGKEGERLGEWALLELMECFRKKFPELILVLAETRGKGAEEEYWFNEAYHYENLNVDKIVEVIKAGKLTIDMRIHIKETGKLRDHGVAFRMSSKDTKELFENVERLM